MRAVDVEAFLAAPGVMLDVRSPAEFARGHIPGAISFPLFTDEERAVVGTLYKMAGRSAAYQKGLEIVGPKLQHFVARVGELTGNTPYLRIYCWRGGKRSESMAWLMEQAGYRVVTMKGGYKAFRRWVLDYFDRWRVPLRVIGGKTGSGKTDVLAALHRMGEPVIDLEALARHRGSAFGHLDQPPQPTQQQFENELALALRSLAGAPYVWVEDESRGIGRCLLPAPLYGRIRSAPLYFLDVPTEQRVQRLVHAYGASSPALLESAFEKIRKRLGPQRFTQAIEALRNGRLPEAARIALHYYDRTYEYGLRQRAPHRVTFLPCTPTDTPETIARRLIARLKKEEGGDGRPPGRFAQ